MPKKSPSRRKKTPPRKSRRTFRQRLWSLSWRLGLIMIVLLAGWMIYLDAVVTSRFEGRRFEVPSRVYARPLELYDGATVSAATLNQELELAGYRTGDG